MFLAAKSQTKRRFENVIYVDRKNRIFRCDAIKIM